MNPVSAVKRPGGARGLLKTYADDLRILPQRARRGRDEVRELRRGRRREGGGGLSLLPVLQAASARAGKPGVQLLRAGAARRLREGARGPVAESQRRERGPRQRRGGQGA